ncbi:indolepyruvate oxidoreductase subunit beta family protein [Aurantimonas sp. VKM B-3413]|uniref:indolepyruvate oxidoreductase subunit beta family protein n=1 Tax=Aurantimonas sp. VKM B-3413 TaxID=2779401 RepID=UPI001E359679|nr:indolepyruvate oxidoreductase subunit beta family protein [Aurantimonas sp. VKM B-3413]MCB8840279.1 indolepyruvate oxidoreductase subunit beta family protein [Aurantimonas sp. VKM B-3413]
MTIALDHRPGSELSDRILSVAILAVGGQGGGVLTDWVVAVAERNGYRAQSTSVAGVAQRTGATIYYIEMCPDRGRQPVFSLSPSPGDVDVLIAAELMEAGRAILRGFVTPNRTTLIASSHRIAAVSEKIVPGDGRASGPDVEAAALKAAKAFVSFDMETMAVEAGSVISSSLFGALAGAGVLPFPRESFEATIKASGRGVEASLRAFAMACDEAARRQGGDTAGAPSAPAAERTSEAPLPLGGQPESEDRDTDGTPADTAAAPSGEARLVAEWRGLSARIEGLPESVGELARLGLRKVVDYQDLAYGREYLDRLDEALAKDDAAHGFALSQAAAKYLANAFAYDDIIRVADLKTRSSRQARVRREIGVGEDAVLQVTEYFHPRIEEFCGTMPAGMGRWIEARPGVSAWLDKRLNRGRHIRTDSMFGFGLLWAVGGLRRFRRKLLRHQVETAHIDRWYRLALGTAARDYELATEILKCRRLIKGYSDTHARGLSKFDRVLSALPMLEGRDDAGAWLRRLREAALKDEKGTTLDGALKTVASFAGTCPDAGRTAASE